MYKRQDYNLRDPRSYPYEGTPIDSSILTTENFGDYTGKTKGNHWDFTRFNPKHFQHIENCIHRLGELGIEADLIICLLYTSYTADEMDHPIRELSGGQKAKVLLLKLSLSNANVLILDEPTRNFSPLSGPVIRQMLAAFPGAIISISHDRKYIIEVCEKVYRLETHGLVETNLQSEG